MYGVKLHLVVCSTNRVALSYELTAANVAEVLLVRELLLAGLDEGGVARRLAIRQQVEVCFAALKRVFGLDGTLATTLVGLATRIAAKVTAYTYGVSTSTGSWGGRRGASRSCGPDILAILI